MKPTCNSCPTGKALIIGANDLSAKYVMHTVGFIWNVGNTDKAGKLKNCYLNSIKMADKQGLKSSLSQYKYLCLWLPKKK